MHRHAHFSTFRICETEYQFRDLSYLARGKDWHRALVPTIDRAAHALTVPTERVYVPLYPLLNRNVAADLLFAMGSYWEGAIYFLNAKMHARDGLSGISEAMAGACPLSELFRAIWNSHGQLKWLKAHFVRLHHLGYDAIDSDSPVDLRRRAEVSGDATLSWLATFVEQHEDEGRKYPNPYFGGSNPLHLDLVGPV